MTVTGIPDHLQQWRPFREAQGRGQFGRWLIGHEHHSPPST
ncbi:DUF2868 domain-containing protein [Geodermatophilus telluris]|nr:DUF2868 domain-containing protein [Geodermatophilus telluris]